MPVKLKTLTLLKSVIAEGSPNVIVCCQAMLAEQVVALESFTCAPDPQYGDKPAQVVQKNAAELSTQLAERYVHGTIPSTT